MSLVILVCMFRQYDTPSVEYHDEASILDDDCGVNIDLMAMLRQFGCLS